jgi:hypothetical protein
MSFDSEIRNYGELQIEGQNVKLYSDSSSFISLNINEEIIDAKWVGNHLHVWLQNGNVSRYSDENNYSTYKTVDNIGVTFLDELKGKKVLLYASSTDIKEDYLKLPYDYVILNNKEYFGNSDMLLVDNKIILMPYDNNRALRILKDAGIKIQCFVGIVDGCWEGGQNTGECVNTNAFFSRLSPILDDKIIYITDHFHFYNTEIDSLIDKIGFLNVHFETIDIFDQSLLFDESVFYSNYFNQADNLWVMPIQRKKYRTIERLVGNISIKVSQASVWDKENDFDCIIYGNNSSGNNYYLPLNSGIHYLPLNQNVINPNYLLNMALHNKWKRIGLIPFMKGNYQEFLNACLNWKGKYPETIHFFHLEDRDMLELRADLENYGVITVLQAKQIYMNFYRTCPQYLDFFGIDVLNNERIYIALSLINRSKVVVPYHKNYDADIESLDEINNAQIIKSMEVLESVGYRRISKSEILSYR